ncbi:MAG TPA: hydrogenase iron-sulfur subunit [bacterium]|nr:hydrogenase iron-sulfur subunit [bacterium]
MEKQIQGFEPRIVGFLCKWCTYSGADLAGTSRMKYPPNLVPIRVMCSGRVDPTFVLTAFARGADAVFIGGCHPGDCHYLEGNYKSLGRYHILARMLEQFGIERERFQLAWISAAEGKRFVEVVTKMTDEVRKLGPLKWPEMLKAADAETHDQGQLDKVLAARK